MFRSQRLFIPRARRLCQIRVGVATPFRLFSVKEKEPFRPGTRSHIHFRNSQRPHPLRPNVLENVSSKDAREGDHDPGDHFGLQQNHVWDRTSLEQALSTHDHKHTPVTITDKFAHAFMYYGLYHPFNYLTGYCEDDPSPKSIEWRLLILESFAGVPGFVAAGFRHFRSIRLLKRDHGWIFTLLEEAENERMHLLTCLKMFNAGLATRVLCVAAQWTMTPLLMGIYIVQPKMLHRFVGYLEQTACTTYYNIIVHCETPGTQLHTAWGHLPAPAIAKGYWKLNEDASWIDTLKCMYADETHHRDVNHTLASMDEDDPNPFLDEHKQNAIVAWKLRERP